MLTCPNHDTNSPFQQSVFKSSIQVSTCPTKCVKDFNSDNKRAWLQVSPNPFTLLSHYWIKPVYERILETEDQKLSLRSIMVDILSIPFSIIIKCISHPILYFFVVCEMASNLSGIARDFYEAHQTLILRIPHFLCSDLISPQDLKSHEKQSFHRLYAVLWITIPLLFR